MAGVMTVMGERNLFLRTLAPEQREALVAEASEAQFEAGRVISRQHTPVQAVLWTVSGTAKSEIVPRFKGSLTVRYKDIGPGDDIGLLSLVRGTVHSATVTAIEPVHALAVSRERLEGLLAQHPEWYQGLAQVAVFRLRTLGQWLYALA
ncbi:MAG: cyclic nucleotide-binding domain-containing protein [Dehalococcoidia bacterium]|nr:cyclic nucleotide-binding domain-containing protein [Dehalococcoidia bacterium]